MVPMYLRLKHFIRKIKKRFKYYKYPLKCISFLFYIVKSNL